MAEQSWIAYCPHCRQKHRFTAEFLGVSVNCVRCDRKFVYDEPLKEAKRQEREEKRAKKKQEKLELLQAKKAAEEAKHRREQEAKERAAAEAAASEAQLATAQRVTAQVVTTQQPTMPQVETPQPTVQVIEQTSKKWKGAILIGYLMFLVGVFVCILGIQGGIGAGFLLGILLSVLGGMTIIVSRIGAWWYHG